MPTNLRLAHALEGTVICQEEVVLMRGNNPGQFSYTN